MVSCLDYSILNSVSYWLDLLTSRVCTTKVKDRGRGATLILPALPGWAQKGLAPYNVGYFTCKRAMGILHGTTDRVVIFAQGALIGNRRGLRSSKNPNSNSNFYKFECRICPDFYLNRILGVKNVKWEFFT